MTYYHKLGQIPHKRHTQYRQPDGTLYHEEVMGIHGFAGVQSILYHLHRPTQIRRVDRHMTVEIEYEEPGPLPSGCSADHADPQRPHTGAG